MRDEDLKNLPQSIEGWRFAEMLGQLGFPEGTLKNLKGFVVSYSDIRAVVYATDEGGHRYAVREPDSIATVELGKKDAQFIEGGWKDRAAEHEISIPIVGAWEKPDADGQMEIAAIALYEALQRVEPDEEDPTWPPADWDAAEGWKTLLADSERERYREQAKVLVAKLGGPAVP